MSISDYNGAKNGQNNQQQPKNQNQTKNENINKPETSKENGCALNQTQINMILNSTKTSTVQSPQTSNDKLNVQLKNSINLSNHKAISPEVLDKFNEYLKFQEIKFSVDKLIKLEDMINRDRWVIPVLPKHELETLLIESIDLAKQGLDINYEPCQRFCREDLITSFTKILCDDAVTNWKETIHKCIFSNCKLLIQFCALKLSSDDDDSLPYILELLALVFNPTCKFHTFNANELAIPSDFLDETNSNNLEITNDEQSPEQQESNDTTADPNNETVYATSKISESPKLWLVNFIEDFGRLDGFDKIRLKFQAALKSNSLNVALISSLVKPFGLCFEYLSEYTVKTYFNEIIEEGSKFLEELTDNELKKESKLENQKNDLIACIIKCLKNLACRLDDPKFYLAQLEILRLKNILKLLKISSFNGKMNALNEINKVISSVDYFAHLQTVSNHPQLVNYNLDGEKCLNSKHVAQWIKDNQVLQIVLKDSLHQPQYVEKLEKIIRFIIKEKQLTLEDLDDLWSAQCGKHEAIVKNVHDLLAKLAWDFTPEQLDHLFECFQNSWTTANKKQREKLLELIRTLAEDDKDGLMAHKVLSLLWSLAHSSDLPTEIMDQALAAHIKILDYSCCQDRDTHKSDWLKRCILELTREDSDPNWVIPSLKQIREICCLYFPSSNLVQSVNISIHQRMNDNLLNRQKVIKRLQDEHDLVEIISRNLQAFMESARELHKANPNLDPNKLNGDRCNRYTHVQEIKERLSFLSFLLKEGNLYLGSTQATEIWTCLVQNSVYKEDREAAFSWFSKLMSNEPDLEPELNRVFFENQILKLDPILLTESGIECFDKFFKVVNLKEGKLVADNKTYYTDNLDLVGLDYLTRIVLNGTEQVSDLAIELLKGIYSNLSNQLQDNKLSIIEEFILSCMDRLSAFHKTIEILEEQENDNREKQTELIKMTRFLKLLYEYLNQCDLNYGDERLYLPMLRSFRGKNVTILIRLQSPIRNIDDVMIETHSNETLLNIKKQYLNKLKMFSPNMQVEFFLNGDHLEQSLNRDKKLVSHLTTKDHFILTARISKLNDNEIFPQQNPSQLIDNQNHFSFEKGINEEAESCLPSVYMSNYPTIYNSLFNFADLGLKLKYKPIYINSLEILKLMPIDKSTSESLIQLSKREDLNSQEISQVLFSESSPTKLCYTLGVIYSLLMPAITPLPDETLEFQVNFIKSGLAYEVQKLITKKDFLDEADDLTKVCAYSIILKISKFVLKTIANYLVLSNSIKQNEQFKNLPKYLEYLQNSNEDFIICQAAKKTANSLIILRKQKKINKFQVNDFIPNFELINFVLHFIWCTASGLEKLPLNQTAENLHQAILDSKSDSDSTIYNICKQGLEVLTMMLMLSPTIFLKLYEDKKLESFTMDLVLFSPEKTVRMAACEQFAFISTMCSTIENEVLKYYIKFLNYHLEHTVPKNYKSSSEFFQLYCKLLNNAYISDIKIPEIKEYLHYEIDLLKNVKERFLVDGLIEDIQLEGHLYIVKELVMMLNSDEKYQIGCKFTTNEDLNSSDEQFGGLLVMLVDEYIFTASRLMVAQQKLSQQRNISGCAIYDTNNLGNNNLIRNNNSSSNSPYNSLGCIYSGDVDAICTNSATLEAAFDLIVALCIGCIPNLKYICDNLIEMFYSKHEIKLTEWEYCPQIGKRSSFSGLKNGGATCYMNSILQQLYMIPEVRDGLLSVEGAIDDSQVEFYDDDITMNLPMNYLNNNVDQNQDDNIRKDYNVGVVKHVQAIFGNLTLNKLQFYVPKGFWCHFRLWGEQINLREQHDALEFFNSLVDSIDEGLKKLNYNKLMASVLGGSFADQKICKGCPHRYSREESFTTLNIDIRNHSNLLESLEQYVKGDLLEGANAYHCEKCNKKVDTVKRLCIKKLPTILTIQLKRFDYDWDRGCSIKFNDYFEFPRMLDMEPYTVNGLARIDGEVIEDLIEQENIDLEIDLNENLNEFDTQPELQCTKYELCGIVVHSGQASGGHYYSYILHKDTDGVKKWYKFDDGDVSEVKLDQDEEMKVQCFGGDYLSEVFDQMLKRMTCRKQKRWWSAYILFYRRIDTEQNQLSLRLNELVLSNANINNNLMRTSSSTALIKQNSGDSECNQQQQSLIQHKAVDANIGELYLRIPTPIRRSVQRQNIKFMHLRNQFNAEYFNFIKNLTSSNHDHLSNQFSNYLNNDQKDGDSNEISITKADELLAKQQVEVSLLCTKLLSKFLFSTCFHTKKNLRGQITEWYDILTMHLRVSPVIRGWFAHNQLVDHSSRFSEYLLDCISAEIRNVFAKLVMFIAHCALQDGDLTLDIELEDGKEETIQCGQLLSDYIMQSVLDLLKKDANDHHLNQYFNLFYQYCMISKEARAQLIKLNVPSRFIFIALDDSIISPLKTQYLEFGRLHQVLSILVRSCDISSRCKPCGDKLLPNPYGYEPDNQYIATLPADTADFLFNKQPYVKKLIEDAGNLDETFQFLKYCCWENPKFSFFVLEELLWHISFYYESELKPNLDILLQILLIQDSWQKIRILNALNGIQQNERDGILDVILRTKGNHQKRAYQCIKFIVSLFTSYKQSTVILQNYPDVRDKYIEAVHWLNEELEGHTLNSGQFNYSWTSNENATNNHRLFRSNSARNILAKAIEICPNEERNIDEAMAEASSSNQQNEDNKQNDNQATVAESTSTELEKNSSPSNKFDTVLDKLINSQLSTSTDKEDADKASTSTVASTADKSPQQKEEVDTVCSSPNTSSSKDTDSSDSPKKLFKLSEL